MERLAEMMTFAKVVETKSFSEAARVLATWCARCTPACWL